MNIWLCALLALITGFLAAAVAGIAVVPWLHKLNFGQTILDIGPSWHKKKQGTPTMGGILIIGGFIVALAVALVTDRLLGGNVLAADREITDTVYVKVFAGIIMSLGFALIGFIDDYIKVIKKQNLGLTEIQKTALQMLVIVAYLFTLFKFAGVNYMFVPYYGMWQNTFVFWILGIFVIYATVNAANLTDGVDGLLSGVTFVICIAFAVCAALRRFTGLGVVSCALAGALAGYLVWNRNPAKVMMGDLGSLFIGGMVCALAYAIDAPWIILLTGFVYVIEAGSDVLQVAYVKTHNGKRLFKMAPLHHHYEMSGWSEKRICVVFSIITVITSAAAAALLWFGRPV